MIEYLVRRNNSKCEIWEMFTENTCFKNSEILNVNDVLTNTEPVDCNFINNWKSKYLTDNVKISSKSFIKEVS